MNRIAIAAAAFALWSVAMFGAGWTWRGDRAEGREADQRAAGAQALADQVNQTRASEQSKALQLAVIGAKHEEDRTTAATVPAAVVAGVRDGSLQLRDDLATCNTARLSEAVAGAVERDAHAQLRAEVAGALVQIGRDADDQVRACQAVIAADRQPVTQ
ncbi:MULTISPECIES: lysis system i-spanin subunit Rz [Stenotrophomonas]|uniref:lysis system i-spanin subunit Rz n=1 Tax=Stenotrophomonas TaxID=40323 RepID=UPI0018D445A7|nr:MULTISPECIES: lysis system i-spanin subunit Rz [Stenotrophomonas]MBH1380125.1 lysis protein [Stenotrophomonas maltophilia]MBH1396584.1 lysis protein [Stenotrophomonas maltophilia]MBH1472834.1 lysis protein [Stenotrophomonas maltophilia]